MLQQIDTKHLAALESELARVTAQRDALRDALSEVAARGPVPGYERADAIRLRLVGSQSIARAALQACQD